MEERNQQIQSFFDRQSLRYKSNLSDKKPYQRYFNRDRIALATRGLNLEGAKILDIGAGAGFLYDYLLEQNDQVDYYASDLSLKMLESSNISHQRYQVGSIYSVEAWSEKRFDYIFLLGVTTYMSKEEWGKNLSWISQHLKDNKARFIVSFTNERALSNRFRLLLGRWIRIKKEDRVLFLSNGVQCFTLKEAQLMASKYGLELEESQFFNFSFFPFNKVFPRFSIFLSKQLSKRAQTFWSGRLASDFLLVFRLPS